MRIERLSTQLFLSFAAFSVLMLMVLGLFSWMSYEAGIEAASQKFLAAEVEKWLAEPENPLPRGKTVVGYAGMENLPDMLRENLHQFEAEDYDVPLWEWEEIQMWRGLHPLTGVEVFFFLEIGETADREVFTPNLQRVIGIGAVVVFVGAVLLGYGISRRLSRPLRHLSEAISHTAPGQEPQRLSGQFPHGETGEVARAFDGLQERLQRFLDRERRFTQDASHELRTPLTLMRTATRVLRNSFSGATLKQERALNHLDQGVDEMTRSVESFLYLARERELLPGDGDEAPVAVLQTLIRNQMDQFGRDPETIELNGMGEPELQVPVDMFRIVAGNLIRNAIQHGGGGHIRVGLTPKELTVEDQGEGIPDSVLDQLGKPFPPGAQPDGVGLGLSIVTDLAHRAGWTVTWSTRESGGTCASLRF